MVPLVEYGNVVQFLKILLVFYLYQLTGFFEITCCIKLSYLTSLGCTGGKSDLTWELELLSFFMYFFSVLMIRTLCLLGNVPVIVFVRVCVSEMCVFIRSVVPDSQLKYNSVVKL